MSNASVMLTLAVLYVGWAIADCIPDQERRVRVLILGLVITVGLLLVAVTT